LNSKQILRVSNRTPQNFY